MVSNTGKESLNSASKSSYSSPEKKGEDRKRRQREDEIRIGIEICKNKERIGGGMKDEVRRKKNRGEYEILFY